MFSCFRYLNTFFLKYLISDESRTSKTEFFKKAYPVDTKFTLFSRYQNEGTESG